MRRLGLMIAVSLGTLGFVPTASAVSCANGVYRAGCVGPNGAAVTRKPYAPPSPTSTACARGVYCAGCVGPNEAAVVRRPH
jgi:hypothetical protein